MTILQKIKEKKVTGLLTRTAVFILIIFALDFVIGRALYHLYYRQQSGILYRSTYAMDSTNADLLIFGASTATHHYYPPKMESALGMSYYNVGQDGQSMFYHYSVLKSILKRYIPKVVVLDFNAREFVKNEESYDRLSALLPYYADHPEIKPIVDLKGPYEKYKMLSKIYPFNSIIFTIGIGNTDLNKTRRNNDDIKGYVPLKRVWTKALAPLDLNYDVDENKVKYFTLFVEDCIKAGVKLYVIVSPRFIRFTSRDTSLQLAQKITASHNIPFYDFSDDSYFLSRPELFADLSHLNKKGSILYTEKIIDSVFTKN